MLAEIVIGIIFALLLLFILGGLMSIHETMQFQYGRAASIQALTVKILVALTEIPMEDVEDVAQCAQCFDEGGLCEKHEVEARRALRIMEESK